MERFRFNPETLSYQKVQTTGKQKLFRFLAFTGLTFSFALGGLVLRDRHMLSPRTDRLTVEQQQITYELDLLNRDVLHYEKVLRNVAFNDDHIYRVYFEVDPWPATLRNAGVGGSNKYAYFRQHKHANLLIRTNRNIDQLERRLVVQSISFDEIIEMAGTKEERIAARPAIQPVSLKDLTRFGSSFGMRFHPILQVVRPHNGIDLTAPRGTNIYATADGTIVQAGYRTGGFGKKILVDHGFGYRTLYGHCEEILVEHGQKVKRGEVIGRVGSTGLSKSPHLHYEVHVNGRPVDPINYYANDLSAEEYDKMIDLLSYADPSFDIN
ncbi:MAG: M23 family metallopeptidase [Bacteroidales bacterium]|nr:M23 family metallopeptidase [Bacteroidales bacterium]